MRSMFILIFYCNIVIAPTVKKFSLPSKASSNEADLPISAYENNGGNFGKDKIIVDENGVTLLQGSLRKTASGEFKDFHGQQRGKSFGALFHEILERDCKNKDLVENVDHEKPFNHSLDSQIGAEANIDDLDAESCSKNGSENQKAMDAGSPTSLPKHSGFRNADVESIFNPNLVSNVESTRSNDSHDASPKSDLEQVCAEAWRSFQWPKKRRRHSHCVTASKEHGVGEALCCNFMGQSVDLSTSQLASRVQLKDSSFVKLSVDPRVLHELHLHDIAYADLQMGNSQNFTIKKFFASSTRLWIIPNSEIIELRNSKAHWLTGLSYFRELTFANSSLTGLRFVELKNQSSSDQKLVLTHVELQFLKEVHLGCPVVFEKASISEILGFSSAGLQMKNVFIKNIDQYGITDNTGPVVLTNVTIKTAEKESINFRGSRLVSLTNVIIEKCIEPCIVYHSQTLETINSYVNGRLLQNNDSAIKIIPKLAKSLSFSAPTSSLDTNGASDFGDRFLLKDADAGYCSRHDGALTCTAPTIEQITELHPPGMGSYEAELSLKNRHELDVLAFCNRRVNMDNFTGSLIQASQMTPGEIHPAQALKVHKSKLSILDVDCRVDLEIEQSTVDKLILSHLESLNVQTSYINDLVFVHKEREKRGVAVTITEAVISRIIYFELNTPAIFKDLFVNQIRQLVIDHGHAEYPTEMVSCYLEAVSKDGFLVKSGVLFLKNITLAKPTPGAIVRIEGSGKLFVGNMFGVENDCNNGRVLISAEYAEQVVFLVEPPATWLKNCVQYRATGPPPHADLNRRLLNTDLHCHLTMPDTHHCDLSALQSPMTLDGRTISRTPVTSMFVLGPNRMILEDVCVPDLTVVSCNHCGMAPTQELCRTSLTTEASNWQTVNSNFWNLMISNSTVDKLMPMSRSSNRALKNAKFFDSEFSLNEATVTDSSIRNISNVVISKSGHFVGCEIFAVTKRGIKVNKNAELVIKDTTFHLLTNHSIVVRGSLTMDEVAVKEAKPGSIVLRRGAVLNLNKIDFSSGVSPDVVWSEQLEMNSSSITVDGLPAAFMTGFKLLARNHCETKSRLTDPFGNNLVCERGSSNKSRQKRAATQSGESLPAEDSADELQPSQRIVQDDQLPQTSSSRDALSYIIFAVAFVTLAYLITKRSFRKKVRSFFSKKQKEETSGPDLTPSFGEQNTPKFEEAEECAEVQDKILQTSEATESSDTSVGLAPGVPDTETSQRNEDPNPDDLPQVHGSATAAELRSGARPKRRTKNTGASRKRLPEPCSSTYPEQVPQSHSRGPELPQWPLRDIQRQECDTFGSREGGFYFSESNQKTVKEMPSCVRRQGSNSRHNLVSQPRMGLSATKYGRSDHLEEDSEDSDETSATPFQRTKSHLLPYHRENREQSGWDAYKNFKEVGRDYDESNALNFAVQTRDTSRNIYMDQSAFSPSQQVWDQQSSQCSETSRELVSRDQPFAPVGLGACPSWQINTPQTSPTSSQDIFYDALSTPTRWLPQFPSPETSPYSLSSNPSTSSFPNYQSAHVPQQTSPIVGSSHSEQESDNNRGNYTEKRVDNFPFFSQVTREAAAAAAERDFYTELTESGNKSLLDRSDDGSREQSVYDAFTEFARGFKNRLSVRPKSGTQKNVNRKSARLYGTRLQPTMITHLGQQSSSGHSTSSSGNSSMSSPIAGQSLQSELGIEGRNSRESEASPTNLQGQIGHVSQNRAEPSAVRRGHDVDPTLMREFQRFMAKQPGSCGIPSRGHESPRLGSHPPSLPSSENYPPPSYPPPPDLPPPGEISPQPVRQASDHSAGDQSNATTDTAATHETQKLL